MVSQGKFIHGYLLTRHFVLLSKQMKRNTLLNILLCLILTLNVFLAGCYTPVSNTSEDLDNDERTELKDNTKEPIKTKESKTTTEPRDKTRSNSETMDKPISSKPKLVTGFRNNFSEHISKYGHSIQDVVDESNSVEQRILHEYGAVFLTKAMPPSKAMFTSDGEVEQFQSKAGIKSVNISGINVELQSDASKALLAASQDAEQKGLSITPRDPKDSAKRSYAQTHTLWNGRFTRGCEYWKGKGRLTSEKIAELKAMPIKKQVAAVLELEKKGIYFSTNQDKSILYSVAAPGTSQHISMLAFDAKEFGNKKVRSILAKHGWFRTVQSDAPHFTYLGYKESELEGLGLKKIADGGFWIPNV